MIHLQYFTQILSQIASDFTLDIEHVYETSVGEFEIRFVALNYEEAVSFQATLMSYLGDLLDTIIRAILITYTNGQCKLEIKIEPTVLDLST